MSGARKRLGYPLYFYLTRLDKRRKKLLVNARTKLVVEGFPRSGNTFLSALIQISFPGLPIAHHLHHIPQLKGAIKLNLPVIFLIRDPRDAISSLLRREESLSVDVAERWYIELNQFALERLDNVQFIHFEGLVNRPQAIIERIAREYMNDETFKFSDSFEIQARAMIKNLPDSRSRKYSTRGYALPHPGKEKFAVDYTASDKVVAVYRKLRSLCFEP